MFCDRVEPINSHFSRRRTDKAEDLSDASCFSGPVGTEETDDLASFDLKIYWTDFLASIVLDRIAKLDYRRISAIGCHCHWENGVSDSPWSLVDPVRRLPFIPRFLVNRGLELGLSSADLHENGRNGKPDGADKTHAKEGHSKRKCAARRVNQRETGCEELDMHGICLVDLQLG